MCKYSTEFLRWSSRATFGVWVGVNVPSSRARNVAFSEQLEGTWGVRGENVT